MMKPYFQEDGITIYCGDNREVMPSLLAGGIDLIFTSPPYNLGNTSGGVRVGGGFPGRRLGHYATDAPLGAKRGGGGTRTGKWSGGALCGGYGTHADAMPHADYVRWQKSFLFLCWSMLSERGAIFYNHKPRILDGRLVAPMDYVPAKLRKYVRQEIIWARAGGINFSPAFYCPTHERIVIIAKPDFRLRDKAASGAGDVWYVPQEANTPHPAPFPLELPKRAIATTKAEVILDPFCGSGTTLRAAKDLGRQAIGVEIEQKYCDIAIERLRQSVLPLTA